MWWKFYTLIRKVYTFICTKFTLSLYSVSVTFLHVTYLTLVTCQYVSNGCRFFEAKVGLFGQLWAFFQPFSWIISTYFLVGRHMLSLLGQVITFDHCPTIGRQFVIFVAGRSTFWHLKFLKINVGRDTSMDAENRQRVDISIGRIWQIA